MSENWKLARVEHVKCGERTFADTYVWVAADMQQDEFAAFVKAAYDAYWAADAAWHNANEEPERPVWAYKLAERFHDKTMGEAKAAADAIQATWDKWKLLRDQHNQPFAYHLRDVGKGRIETFWKVPPGMTEELSWGHRHGRRINYGVVDPTTKDINAPKPDDDD